MRLYWIALVVALIAIALGIYVRFVLGNDAGTIAIALGAMVAALAAVLGARANKDRNDAR